MLFPHQAHALPKRRFWGSRHSCFLLSAVVNTTIPTAPRRALSTVLPLTKETYCTGEDKVTSYPNLIQTLSSTSATGAQKVETRIVSSSLARATQKKLVFKQTKKPVVSCPTFFKGLSNMLLFKIQLMKQPWDFCDRLKKRYERVDLVANLVKERE